MTSTNPGPFYTAARDLQPIPPSPLLTYLTEGEERAVTASPFSNPDAVRDRVAQGFIGALAGELEDLPGGEDAWIRAVDLTVERTHL